MQITTTIPKIQKHFPFPWMIKLLIRKWCEKFKTEKNIC